MFCKREATKGKFSECKMANCYEEMACKRIIHCTNAGELRNTEKYLRNIRCKRENKISNIKRKYGRGTTFILIRINVVG
jgi:hypothetical protein